MIKETIQNEVIVGIADILQNKIALPKEKFANYAVKRTILNKFVIQTKIEQLHHLSSILLKG